MIDFKALPQDQLKGMEEAGNTVLECYRLLAKTGDNIVGEVLKNQGEFYEWDHYPKGDVYDPETHSQYYYHAHAAGERPDEHGHFHTFLRPKGMPDGIKPAPVEDLELPPGDNDALSHLIGISMNAAGFPIRIFTVNRWVTGEVWYKAQDVKTLLDYFDMDLAYPSLPVNLWLTAMVKLFRPQIETLLEERDLTLAKWQEKGLEESPYEDRDLEVTSYLDIDVAQQIQAVDQVLRGA